MQSSWCTVGIGHLLCITIDVSYSVGQHPFQTLEWHLKKASINLGSQSDSSPIPEESHCLNAMVQHILSQHCLDACFMSSKIHYLKTLLQEHAFFSCILFFWAITQLQKGRECSKQIISPGFIIPYPKMNWKAKVFRTWPDKHSTCRIPFDKQPVLYGEKHLGDQRNKAAG